MSKQTLRDRLLQAMEGPPSVTAADLARACQVKPPSVSNWLSGKTKTLKGESLTRAARKLGVSPAWLGLGDGPMKPTRATPAEQPSANCTPIAPTQLEERYTIPMVREVARSLRMHAERHRVPFSLETVAGAAEFLHWLSVRSVLPDAVALEALIELDSRRRT